MLRLTNRFNFSCRSSYTLIAFHNQGALPVEVKADVTSVFRRNIIYLTTAFNVRSTDRYWTHLPEFPYVLTEAKVRNPELRSYGAT
jgi:hypothetical protein